MNQKSISILGGGIAGLTTAIALQKIGITATIFEASKQILPVGAGLGLGSNALMALREIDLQDEVTRAGHPMKRFSLYDESGSRITESSFENRNRPTNVAIHRATLHEILLSKLDPNTIYTDKRLKDFTKTDTGIKLTFQDGSTHHTDYLIVADGIHSLVRQKLCASTPRYAGYTCWRCVIYTPLAAQLHPSETWGKNGRIGIVPLSDNIIYWFACINAPMGDPTYKQFGIPELVNQFKNLQIILVTL